MKFPEESVWSFCSLIAAPYLICAANQTLSEKCSMGRGNVKTWVVNLLQKLIYAQYLHLKYPAHF